MIERLGICPTHTAEHPFILIRLISLHVSDMVFANFQIVPITDALFQIMSS